MDTRQLIDDRDEWVGFANRGGWVPSELLEKAAVGILVMDTLNESVVYQNDRARRLLRRLSTPARYDLIETLFTREARPHQPAVLRRGNQRIGYTRYDADGGYRMILFQDIAAKYHQYELERLRQRFDLIGLVLHHIDNRMTRPLAEAIARLSSVSRSDSEAAPVVADVLALLKPLHQELTRTARQFGESSAILRETDLQERVREWAEDWRQNLIERGVALHLISGSEVIEARVDIEQFLRILDALLDNALAAVADRPHPQVLINLYQTGSVIHLKMEDNGHGMDAAQVEHAFDPFVTSRHGAAGLGLALAQKHFAGMGGRIELRSLPGTGTIVHLLLPTVPNT